MDAMFLSEHEKRSAHFFAGCGGDLCGLKLAGWSPCFAVELNPYRCQTLRRNHPEIKVFEGPIQRMVLADYPAVRIPLFFCTFPCDNYTLAANVHGHWTGDSLYLEALREVVLGFPEMVVVENVLGFKKFKRALESWRALPHYHTTEVVLYGEDFSLQRKARVFLILHRQAYDFSSLLEYRLPRRGDRLGDYLEWDAPLPEIPPYIAARLQGKYRDLPRIYEPDRREPVNLFTNYGRDRSLFLVRDERAPLGVRPFTVREVANLQTFPTAYEFIGPFNERMDMIVDCVLPSVAYTLGMAASDYFAAVPALADPPRHLGYHEITPRRSEQPRPRSDGESTGSVLLPLVETLEESDRSACQAALW
jgi:DNA (cytosine-5)-methyltransferase 1